MGRIEQQGNTSDMICPVCEVLDYFLAVARDNRSYSHVDRLGIKVVPLGLVIGGIGPGSRWWRSAPGQYKNRATIPMTASTTTPA